MYNVFYHADALALGPLNCSPTYAHGIASVIHHVRNHASMQTEVSKNRHNDNEERREWNELFFPNNFNLLHPVEWPAILIRTSSESHVEWLLASRQCSFSASFRIKIFGYSLGILVLILFFGESRIWIMREPLCSFL